MTALLVLAVAGIFAAVMAGVWRAGFQAGLATAPYCVPASESALVSAAEERVRVRDRRIAVLESVRLVPADLFTVLPWQQVPTRAEVSTMQALADEVIAVRAELAEVRGLLVGACEGWARADATRQKHWNLVKNLRIRLAAMVPVEEFAAVEDLRTRSLSVARSAASRAADNRAVITEIEIALVESMDLDQFNAQFEQILTDHGIEVGAN